MSPSTRIAIIGSSNRDGRLNHLSVRDFHQLADCVDQRVQAIRGDNPEPPTLVSGGSTWADHIAVHLFLRSPNEYYLVLYLPGAACEQGFGGTSYDCRRLDGLHAHFSEQLGHNTYHELLETRGFGAEHHDGKSFAQRNTLIAQNCDALIAVTYAQGDRPPSGSGTLQTWNKYPKHVTRHHLSIHERARR